MRHPLFQRPLGRRTAPRPATTVASAGRLFSSSTDENTDGPAWTLSCSTSDLIQRAEFQAALYSARPLWQRMLSQTVTFLDDRTTRRSTTIDLRVEPITLLLERYTFAQDSFFLPALTAMRPEPVLAIEAASTNNRTINVAHHHENLEAVTLQIVGAIWLSLTHPLRFHHNHENHEWVKDLALAIFGFLADRKATRDDLLCTLIGSASLAEFNALERRKSDLLRGTRQSELTDDETPSSRPDPAQVARKLSENMMHIIAMTRIEENAALRRAPDRVYDYLLLGNTVIDYSPFSFLDEICEQKNGCPQHLVYTPSRDARDNIEDDNIDVTWLETGPPHHSLYPTNTDTTMGLWERAAQHLRFGTHYLSPAPDVYAISVPILGTTVAAHTTHLKILAPEEMTLGRVSVAREGWSDADRALLRYWYDSYSNVLSDDSASPTVEVVSNEREVKVLHHKRNRVSGNPGLPPADPPSTPSPWTVLVTLNPIRRQFLVPTLLNLVFALSLVITVHTTDTPCGSTPTTSFIAFVLSALTVMLGTPREHSIITVSHTVGRVGAFISTAFAALYMLRSSFGYQDGTQTALFVTDVVLMTIAILYLLTRIVLIECSTIEAFRLRHNLKYIGPTDSGRLDVPRYHDLPARLRRDLWLAGLHQLVLRMLSGPVSDMRFRNRVARWWDAAVEVSTATSHRSSGTNPASGS